MNKDLQRLFDSILKETVGKSSALTLLRMDIDQASASIQQANNTIKERQKQLTTHTERARQNITYLCKVDPTFFKMNRSKIIETGIFEGIIENPSMLPSEDLETALKNWVKASKGVK